MEVCYDELTPAQVARLKEIEADLRSEGEGFTIQSDLWPDEANRTLRFLFDENQRLRAALELIAENSTDKLKELQAKGALANIGPKS